MAKKLEMFKPPHPGEFIAETYLRPLGISARELASKLEVTPSTLHRVLVGSSGLSPEMAMRLSKVLGRTPQSWLEMQSNYSIWQLKQLQDFDSLVSLELQATH